VPRPVGEERTYLPGLDGVRALAVLAVLGFHLGFPQMAGGLLGVGVFFTLSGFLITRILLSSWQRTGTLELGRFWLARARRLLPALAVVLTVVLAWTALSERPLLAQRGEQAAAAAAYVANWHTIAAGETYFQRFTGPGPLDHLWSLSVEEQFYVVWPLLLLLAFGVFRLRRRTLVVLTLLTASLSFVLLAVLVSPGFDHTRAYEGTDTRAGGILVGALLALVWDRLGPVLGSSRVRRFGVDLLGVAGLVGIGWLVTHTDDYSLGLYRGGILLLSVCTAAVVAAVAVPRTGLGFLLGREPLRWLGERSYAIYLWQLPVIVAVSSAALDAHRYLWGALVTATVLVLAELSWRLVEDPIRRYGLVGAVRRVRLQIAEVQGAEVPGAEVQGDVRRMTHLPLLPIGLATMLVAGTFALMSAQTVDGSRASAATVLAPDVNEPPIPPDVADFAGRGGDLDAAGPGITGHRGLDESPDRTPTAQGHWGDGRSGDSGAQLAAAPLRDAHRHRHRTRTPATATSCSSVVVIGESTSLGLVSPAYLPDASLRLPAQLRRHGVSDIRTDILGARSIVERWHNQPNAQDAVQAQLKRGYRGCWIIAMGTNDSANQAVGGVYSSTQRIDLLMKKLSGQPVLWLTVKSRNKSGAYADSHMQAFDQALLKACSRYPDLRVYDWRAEVQDSWFVDDGIHFTSAGYAQRSRRIADALANAFPADGAASSSCVVSSS